MKKYLYLTLLFSSSIFYHNFAVEIDTTAADLCAKKATAVSAALQGHIDFLTKAKAVLDDSKQSAKHDGVKTSINKRLPDIQALIGAK